MKVIILKDTPNLGRKYDVKNVADGHALNFLFPRGLAEIANADNMKKIEQMRAQHEAELRIREDLLMKNLKDLEGVRIELNEKANEKGHLFAGIHKSELIGEIKKQTNLDIDQSHIILDQPIKEIGEYDIKIKVQDKEASFKLLINKI